MRFINNIANMFIIAINKIRKQIFILLIKFCILSILLHITCIIFYTNKIILLHRHIVSINKPNKCYFNSKMFVGLLLICYVY